MRARRVGALPLALLLVGCAIAGCGSAGPQAPDLSGLPLVSGASVVAQARHCDSGANPYCAVEVVIVDPRFRSSLDMLVGERNELVQHGWNRTSGDTGNERAAESPGHKLRVTYATPYGDLQGIDLGWIERPEAITMALSRALFARSSALSMMLELGSG